MSLATNLLDSRTSFVENIKNNSFGPLPQSGGMMPAQQNVGVRGYQDNRLGFSSRNLTKNYTGTSLFDGILKTDLLNIFSSEYITTYVYILIAFTIGEMGIFIYSTFSKGGFPDDDKCVTACLFAVTIMCYFNIFMLGIIAKNKGLTGMVLIMYFFYSAIVTIFAAYVIFKSVKDDESAEKGGVTGSGLTIVVLWIICLLLRIFMTWQIRGAYKDARKDIFNIGNSLIRELERNNYKCDPDAFATDVRRAVEMQNLKKSQQMDIINQLNGKCDDIYNWLQTPKGTQTINELGLQPMPASGSVAVPGMPMQGVMPGMMTGMPGMPGMQVPFR